MSYAALPVLRTLRLTLRPLSEGDVGALVQGVGNYDVSRWLAVVPYPYGEEDARAFIAELREKDSLTWGIEADAQLVGVISTGHELGYWLARTAWGQGYAREAGRAVIAHWFADRSREVLRSGHFEGNDRSAAVLAALGFEADGWDTRHARALSQEVRARRMVLTRARWAGLRMAPESPTRIGRSGPKGGAI